MIKKEHHMSGSARETEDLGKLVVGGRMMRNGRTRRALIARLLSEQSAGSDEEGDEDTTEEGGDDDRQLVKALLGSRMLKRRRLRRVLLAHLIKARGASEADDEVDDDNDEDVGEEESGDEDRKLLRLVLGSRILRKRRVRRALIAKLLRDRSGAETDDDELDDDVDESDDDVGEEGGDSERKFLRLLVGSRILRKRRVRRALLAKLLKDRSGGGETEDDYDDGEDEDEDVEEGPDLERSLARLLVGGRVVRRRRTRKAALARFLRNRG
jgi:hypothetical protein